MLHIGHRSGEPRVSRTSVKVTITKELEERLKVLAKRQGKPLDEALEFALNEYADTWEDHLNTLEKLKDGDDRVQLAVANET